MLKSQVRNYAAANGVVAKYSGRSRQWHFSKNRIQVSRGHKDLTQKKLDNSFQKFNQ